MNKKQALVVKNHIEKVQSNAQDIEVVAGIVERRSVDQQYVHIGHLLAAREMIRKSLSTAPKSAEEISLRNQQHGFLLELEQLIRTIDKEIKL